MPRDCPTSHLINNLVCSCHRNPPLSNFFDEEIYTENKTGSSTSLRHHSPCC
ncbi:hypothetical protein MUK42_27488 [Musa troglodytarum]|uniref:Uncharacterized protein n=1 Tax=Musa troglodytarum TaxID=320322 RepID=A0A9E7JLC0_9LILI|nr:hypothetical protein MUK42_27488 [Musa troglodytarum]